MRRVQERRVYYVRRQSLQILFGGTIFPRTYIVHMEIVNLPAGAMLKLINPRSFDVCCLPVVYVYIFMARW
jgi:hypothetical protein